MALGLTRFSFPSQSSPQSIITFALRYETSSDVCIRCRRVRASISPRVPRNVSFIHWMLKRFHKCCSIGLWPVYQGAPCHTKKTARRRYSGYGCIWLALACSCALDLIQRSGVFQRRGVAEFFAEVRGAHDAAHDFGVSRFWYVTNKEHLARRERLAKIPCYLLFQFGGERGIAVCVPF